MYPLGVSSCCLSVLAGHHTSTVCLVLLRVTFPAFPAFRWVRSCHFLRCAVIAQSLGLHKKLKFGRRAAVSGSKEKLNKAKDR